MRGLKLAHHGSNKAWGVAPHTGALIETEVQFRSSGFDIVAPHTGAWIETVNAEPSTGEVESHPTRVRGLKRALTFHNATESRRTPHGCVD